MKGWYKTVTKCLPPTARVTLEQVTTEWEALYRWVPPPRDSIPVCIDPFPVDDYIKIVDNIWWLV